jgi:hypothetical protein
MRRSRRSRRDEGNQEQYVTEREKHLLTYCWCSWWIWFSSYLYGARICSQRIYDHALDAHCNNCVRNFLALRYRTLGGFKKADSGRLIFVGIADFMANVLLGIATTHGYVSIAIVLGSLFPVVTVALAFIILRERLHTVQYFGALFAVAGVCLVSL